MAKIQNVSGVDLFVPVLGREVKADDVVEVDDALYESFVPEAEHRSPDHPWSGIEAPAKAKKAAKSKDD